MADELKSSLENGVVSIAVAPDGVVAIEISFVGEFVEICLTPGIAKVLCDAINRQWSK